MVKKKELCIVHIGMPKTGSSTLQEAFFSGLKDTRVSYANLPEANQSGRLYGLFVDNPIRYHYFSKKNFSLSQIEEFKEKNIKLLIDGFLKHNTSIEILSGEDLFHLGSIENVKKIKLLLEPYFKKIIIVAYVRPVKSFMESAFQQLVKNHYLGNFNFNMIYHKYKNFEAYDEVFGVENVKLWKFQPEIFPKGDIVLDFCKRVNIKPTCAKVKVVNESLSMEAISILFTYHFHKGVKSDFGSKLHIINNNLVEKIRKIGNTKFKFSNKLIKNVININRSDYEWIISRIGEDFREDFRENLNEDNDIGISTENELMWFATESIDVLANMVGSENINFKLEKHPQTVAKLVNLLMIKINRAL